LDGGVESIGEGIENDAHDRDAEDSKAEGDADIGEPVNEVRGAVNGVDDEGGVVGKRGGTSSFFAQEAIGNVLGEVFEIDVNMF
jgi:hypothetical protein